MAQRISRAKARLRRVGAPFAAAARRASCRPGVAAVLQVLYLVFTEGHTATVRRRPASTSPWPTRRSGSTRQLHRLLPRRRRGRRAARPDAAHRRPPGRPAPTATASWCRWPSRTASRWDRDGSPRASRSSRRRCRPGRSGPTSCRPPSPRCTPRPRRPRTPTGRRSRRSTRCWPTSRPARGHPQPGRRSGHVDGPARRAGDARSLCGDRRHGAAATDCTPSARTCSSRPATRRRRARRTHGPRRWRPASRSSAT